jgi:hypothetical protein
MVRRRHHTFVTRLGQLDFMFAGSDRVFPAKAKIACRPSFPASSITIT